MIVKNGVEPENVSADDFEMASAASDKIVLPYVGKIWGDLLHEAERITLDAMDDSISDETYLATQNQIVDKVSAEFLFNVQRHAIRITAYIDVIDVWGGKHSGRAFINADSEEVKPIMDQFFKNGCVGLSAEYASYYTKAYLAWLNKKKFCCLAFSY